MNEDNLEFSFKAERFPTILEALKDMLLDGHTIEVTLYDQRTVKKEKVWKPITKMKVRAWKS